MNEFCLEKRPSLDMKAIFTKAVGQEIYRIRRNQGLTGRYLAQKLNISQQQVSRYECGICHITIDTLILMLSILNISIDAFFKAVYFNVLSDYNEIEMQGYNSLHVFKHYEEQPLNGN